MFLHNVKRLSLVILLIGCLFSCRTRGGEDQKSAAVQESLSCELNPAHTYELYIPACVRPENGLPLLVVIDAHGGGKLAVSKFKAAVKKYPAVLVASNLIQNNDQHYLQEMDELIDDVKNAIR